MFSIRSRRVNLAADPGHRSRLLELREKLCVWGEQTRDVVPVRRVPVELIVNGQSVARQEIVADGELREVSFELPLAQSSWVALRILPSSHTNPIFVIVDGRPIRPSRRSVEWCLKAID